MPVLADADIGQIVAATLTRKKIDEAFQVGPLLDQVGTSAAPFAADGAYDQDSVSTAAATRRPAAAIVVPPRSTAAPGQTAEAAPMQQDRHLHSIAEHGRAAWQKASGDTKRARAEAAIDRFKQAIGDGLRSRTDARRATEVGVAVHVLNRMWTWIARASSALLEHRKGWDRRARIAESCNMVIRQQTPLWRN